MAELRTEEEQIEAIKNWWRQNGRSTLLGIVLAVVAVLGWRGWQDYQQNQAEGASVLYQNLLQAVAVGGEQALSPEQLSTARHLAGRLQEDYPASTYADFASLWLANLALDQGNQDQARQALESLLAEDTDARLAELARQRLAALLLAQKQYDEALAALEEPPIQGFAARYHELKGDILSAGGEHQKAQAAYTKAAETAGMGGASPWLPMKQNHAAPASEG